MSKITTTEIINGLYSRSGTLGIANQIKMADDNDSATISEAINNLSDKIAGLKGVYYYLLDDDKLVPYDGIYHFDGSERLDAELSCVNGIFGFFTESSGDYHFKPIGGNIEYLLDKIENVWYFDNSIPTKYSIDKNNLFISIYGSSGITINDYLNGWRVSVEDSGITSDMIANSAITIDKMNDSAVNALSSASSVYETVVYGIEAVYTPFNEYEYGSLITEWYSAHNPSEVSKLVNQNVWYIDHGSLDYGLTNTINLQVPISASELTNVVHNKSFIIKNSTIANNQTEGTGNYNVSIDNILGDARFGESININNDYIFLVPSGVTTGTWTAKALVGKKYSDILNTISN